MISCLRWCEQKLRSSVHSITNRRRNITTRENIESCSQYTGSLIMDSPGTVQEQGTDIQYIFTATFLLTGQIFPFGQQELKLILYPSLTATINNILTDSLLPIASTSHHWSIYNAARPYKLTTGIPYLFDKWHLILTVFIYSYN